MKTLVFDSCHSTWIFDTEGRRFRRGLKGLTSGGTLIPTEWREYARLFVDPTSPTFVVWLNHSGTRVLRSWRHRTHRCETCGQSTTPQDLEEAEQAVLATTA